MLKITVRDSPQTASLRLEGSIRGPWVTVLQNTWRALLVADDAKPVRVDLSQVSFADSRGLDLLLHMKHQGVALTNPSMFLDHMLCKQSYTAIDFAKNLVGGQQ